MMIAGAATLMPSDRLPCEGEKRPLSAIKQHYFPFQTHILTLVYAHIAHICTHTHTQIGKHIQIKLEWGGGALNLTARHYALWTKGLSNPTCFAFQSPLLAYSSPSHQLCREGPLMTTLNYHSNSHSRSGAPPTTPISLPILPGPLPYEVHAHLVTQLQE